MNADEVPEIIEIPRAALETVVAAAKKHLERLVNNKFAVTLEDALDAVEVANDGRIGTYTSAVLRQAAVTSLGYMATATMMDGLGWEDIEVLKSALAHFPWTLQGLLDDRRAA
jgi:hypothetical protein